MRPALTILVAAAAAAPLTGCGGNSALPRDPAPVRLTVTQPGDRATVRDGTVTVSGTVSPPRARVAVMGRAASVTGGSFSIQVPLQDGMNLVDVAASARGRQPAFAALRITRDPRVTVPALTGDEVGDAQGRLESLGLSVSVERTGGLIDAFRGGPVKVCGSDPAAGAKVQPGSGVSLQAAHRC